MRFPLHPEYALVLTHPEDGEELGASDDERIYEAGEPAARRLNFGTLTFPPSDRLL